MTAASHEYRRSRVEVAGGRSTVGVWEPVAPPPGPVPTVCAIHGITSNHLFLAGLAAALPGVRVIAPDLRGRAGSRHLGAPYGMRAHAQDVLAAVEAFAEPGEVTLVGHSLGGFVAMTLAGLLDGDRAPAEHRFRGLVLIDGGLPRPPRPARPPRTPGPADPDDLLAAVGPAARLAMVFDGVEEYLDFFRAHPAFADGVDPVAGESFRYDLVADGAGGFRASTSAEAMQADSDDVYGAPDFGLGVERVMGDPARRRDVHLVVAEGDLVAARPGLYTAGILDEYRRRWPGVRITEVADTNHYDILLSGHGILACAEAVLAALGSDRR
ncbi:alpha/beta fold hydrolase [Kitasatospora sp. NPDC057500]|uniref:alpha/beta fold hydrolase n=1 Tax=Kitasatospora sp. NPDC057500 TaxID=3346151 RepID=UPI0036AF1D23